MPTPETIFLIAVTFLVAGFVKGVVGMGLPVVVLGVLATPLGLKEAMALMLMPSLLSNLWQGLTGGGLVDILKRFWSFFTAAALGIWIGVGILAGGRETLLLGMLGFMLCAYAGLASSRFRPTPPGPAQERWLGPLAGGLGGVMFGMTGMFIVPGILYLQALGLRRDLLVQAMGVTFLVISTSLAVSMAGRKMMPTHLILLSALAFVPTIGGMMLGSRCRQRISEEGFRRLILAALFASGLYNLGRAVF